MSVLRLLILLSLLSNWRDYRGEPLCQLYVVVGRGKPRAPCILGKHSNISRQPLLSANVCFVSLFVFSFLPSPPSQWQLSPELGCFFRRGLTKEVASVYQRSKCFSQILQLPLQCRKANGAQKRLTFLSLSHWTTTLGKHLTTGSYASTQRFNCLLCPKAPSGSSGSKAFQGLIKFPRNSLFLDKAVSLSQAGPKSAEDKDSRNDIGWVRLTGTFWYGESGWGERKYT